MNTCPLCDTANAPGVRFCQNCGAMLSLAPVAPPAPAPEPAPTPPPTSNAAFDPGRGLSSTCPGCGAPLAADARFCEECGRAAEPAPQPAIAPEPESPAPIAAREEAAPALFAPLAPADEVPAEEPPAPAEPAPAPAPFVAPPWTAPESPPAPLSPLEPLAPGPAPEPQPSAPGALVLVEGTVRFNLTHRERALIGRLDAEKGVFPDIDLTPYDDALGVSRRHAEVLRRGYRWFAQDLGSLNGTWLNDYQLTPGRPVALQPGDHITVGHILLRFDSVYPA